MGFVSMPLYGKDIDVGSAIEVADKVIAKIKANKFTAKDIEDYANANKVIIDYANKVKAYDNKD